MVQETRALFVVATAALAAADSASAVDAARRAFAVAKAQRSHELKSRAYLLLIETLAVVGDESRIEYLERVEDAFDWAETMPEEIQAWLFPALIPHLHALTTDLESHARRRLEERAVDRAAKAQSWLDKGSINVHTALQSSHLDDLAAGRPIDRHALALERTAAFYASELFDPTGELLAEAARAWARAGRPDRAALIQGIIDKLRRD